MKRFLTYATVFLGGVALLSLMGCQRAEERNPRLRTLETENAERTIDQYKETSTSTDKAQAERALAQLDTEIRELEVRVANTTGAERAEAQSKLDDLRSRRAQYSAEMTGAKIKDTVRSIAE